MEHDMRILRIIKSRPSNYGCSMNKAALMKLSASDIKPISKKSYMCLLNNEANPVETRLLFCKLDDHCQIKAYITLDLAGN